LPGSIPGRGQNSKLKSNEMTYTKKEIIEMICRQYPDCNNEMIEVLSNLPDKTILREAKKAGLNIERIKTGLFILNQNLS